MLPLFSCLLLVRDPTHLHDLVSLTLTVINWRYLLNGVLKITRLGCRPTFPIILSQIFKEM